MTTALDQDAIVRYGPQLPLSVGRMTCVNDRIRSNGGPRRVRQHSRGVTDLGKQIDMDQRTCSVPECEKLTKARGWCNAHYHRWKKHGDPQQLWQPRGCSVEDCGRPHSSRGYCAPHYARWRRTGDPGPAMIAAPGVSGACSVQGCERKRKARGLCQQHYSRWVNSGDPGAAEIRAKGDTRVRDEYGRKRCTKCSEWRPESDFGSAPRAADKLHCHCYRCHRAGVLRRRYGVTIQWYEATLADQGGACALCSKVNGDGRLLAVDHDHGCCPGETSCGKCARALLCTRCNTGLGAFGDDVGLMTAAIEYVRAAREARSGVPG